MNKIVLLPIIIIAIIYFVIAQLIPSVTTSLDLRTQRDNKILEVEKAKKQKDTLTKFMNEVNSHQNELEFVSNFIPKDPKENDIINILDQKAKDNSISLFIVDPSDKISRENSKDTNSVNVNSSEVTISLTGSYDDIKKFLTDVFFMNRLYSLDTLKIEKEVLSKKESEVSSSNNLNVKMVFNYKYVPTDLSISNNDVSNGLTNNYDFVNKIMDLSTQLKEIEKAEPGRSNPFLPS